MKKWLLLLLVLNSYLITSAQANKKDVRILLEVSGLTDNYSRVINELAEQIPEESKEDFKKDVQFFVDRQINSAIEKYAAVFSQDEILKLIEFYKSPLGIKLLKETSKINNAISDELEENQPELQSIIMKYFM
nr:DUF2059 domain-containing protein [uncultured Flavobacterium sp.]